MINKVEHSVLIFYKLIYLLIQCDDTINTDPTQVRKDTTRGVALKQYVFNFLLSAAERNQLGQWFYNTCTAVMLLFKTSLSA